MYDVPLRRFRINILAMGRSKF